jgi:glycosyltransferase involved in cell wall biosynthesis
LGISARDRRGGRVSDRSRLSVVLPAFNEEANIVEAVARATAVADRLFADHEVIAVDDGSRDRTAELVRELAAQDPRVRLVQHPRNLGYGEALRTGFQSARMDLVLLTDADNQFDLNELELFVPWIQKVDIVCGYLINRQDPLVRRLMGKSWNYLVRALFYVPVRDIDCAFKLMRRRVFEDLDLESVGAMVSTELMVKLGRSGAGVVEVGVHHYPRTAGQARGANPKVILRAFWELSRIRRRLSLVGVGSARPPSSIGIE